MIEMVYHATTPAKLTRYCATGCILAPVRYWLSEKCAAAWALRVRRTVILAFQRPSTSYPLPDHKPRMMAHWTPDNIRIWTQVR